MWVSSELAGYTSFPGLSNVIKVTKRVKRLKQGEWVESEQYAVTSLNDIDPKGALSLVQGHWGIENRLFHVKDDSFGEDRHVMQHHGSGAVLSLLRNVALTLLRGACSLWSSKEPLTGRAQRLGVRPTCCPDLTLTLERPCLGRGAVAMRCRAMRVCRAGW